ncbi:MAG TPA: ATP-binding protein [Pyrinomonadaceae bacterium]|jgi:two-component system phosphate regulon sensor histidine kinase PhoR|nr:ATP-binding protein [Pyrinomonadaceae bacterium]
MKFSSYRPVLVAVVLLAVAFLLVPSISLLTASALVLALTGGLAIGVWLARRPKVPATLFSREDFHDTLTDLETPQIFALGKLFEATLGGMREGLLVIDRDLRVVASNPAAYQLFLRSEGVLQSQRLTQLTPNTAITGAFVEALQGEERSGVRIETHGPARKIFDLRVVPLTAADKSVQGAIGVFFDITKLERLELVRQEFLSNVSHELRTPLTAILAFVETLEESDIPEEDRQRFLSIIKRNANRMHVLIDDILELSAIEAGNIQVKPEEVHLQHIVNDVITSLLGGASALRISLENKVGNDVRVTADPRRLEQMLTNLVDNAIKFNREGGRVTIKHENGDRDRIFIEDTGEGIPAQHLQRLFERFYRVDRARSRELGGTGLGLAIVKHLARIHGGEVTVESRLGEGSRFTIELPRGH